MDPPNRELRRLLSGAAIPTHAREAVLRSLEDHRKGPPGRDILGLVRLLTLLRTSRLDTVTTRVKIGLCENLFRLVDQDSWGRLREICVILLDAHGTEVEDHGVLPRSLTRALAGMGIVERSERSREVLWLGLIRNVTALDRLVTPENLVFGIWLENPLSRNTIIRFLFRHFSTEDIARAVAVYASEHGDKIPGGAFRAILSAAGEGVSHPERRRLVMDLMKMPEIEPDHVDRIWAEHLGSLSRFELIQMLPAGTGDVGRLVQVGRPRIQLSFPFTQWPTMPNPHAPFQARVAMISLCAQDPP